MGDAHPFASATLGRHLVRGLAGFGLVAAAFGLLGVVGPLSFALLPLGLLALRGCPMCWTLGLDRAPVARPSAALVRGRSMPSEARDVTQGGTSPAAPVQRPCPTIAIVMLERCARCGAPGSCR
jgi:hypothetical protein